ncbi:MAG TPA: hypothetical protein VK888_06545, partial [Anaerolineales bacterium]|nr:hypothetical protein [Anaerolineales bacterium]
MYDSELQDDWLDRFARFNAHFGRFMRDALGIFLIAFALMTLLALGGFTGGLFLIPWAGLLSLWFGWGAYLVVLAIGFTGFAILQGDSFSIGWGRLFALELAAFLTISLFAALGGNSLLRAESGMDGGRIGWGLVNLFWRLGEVGGTLLLFVLWAVTVMTGFGVWAVIERWLMKLAGEVQPAEVVTQPELQEEVPAEKPEAERPARKRPAN